ncbi:hypothetical protein LX36DRAFT_182419 [Colletotrichum falcatum]|nr:hypothetical protein LX36DRAFT_182419 [Colletotrichum falcatum]
MREVVCLVLTALDWTSPSPMAGHGIASIQHGGAGRPGEAGYTGSAGRKRTSRGGGGGLALSQRLSQLQPPGSPWPSQIAAR